MSATVRVDRCRKCAGGPRGAVALLLSLAVVAAGAPAAASATALAGAGSALVAPLAGEWAQGFAAQTGIRVTYRSIGASLGVTDVASRTVDFAGDEAPLTPAQRSACRTCIEIPWALSAVAVGYHVRGIGRKLRLTGSVLAQIYLGRITRWNDARIAALNRGLRLPSTRITPVYVRGGSGETYVFTSYLAAVSPEWKRAEGVGTEAFFPTGAPAQTAAGVPALLAAGDGTIAYAGADSLVTTGLPAAAIGNAAGRYEYPNLTNIAAAGAALRRPPQGFVDLVNPPRSAAAAYPIATFTYAVVPTDTAQGPAVKRFVDYAVGAGQEYSAALDFVPLPRPFAVAARALAGRIAG